jgi:hypothetical protein
MKTQGRFGVIAIVLALAYGGTRFSRLPRPHQGALWISTILLGVWILNPGVVVARAALFVLPVLFLAVAGALSRAPVQTFKHVPVVGIVLVGVTLRAAFLSLQLLPTLRSSYPDAASYLASFGGAVGVIDPRGWPLWQYYLERRIDARPETVRTITGLRDYVSRYPRVAFISQGRASAARSTAEVWTFYNHLLDRPSDKTWDMPIGRVAIFRHEGGTSAENLNTEQLVLYWLRPEEIKKL